MHNSGWLLKYSVAATIAATIIAATSLNVVDFDIWHEMALAREVFASGRFPDADIFAYTPTLYPFVHHEWGAGLIAYVLATRVGPGGILGLKYLLIAVIAGICCVCARGRGERPFLASAVLAIPAAGLAATGYLPVRAQAYTFVGVAALCWALICDNDGSRKWIAPWLAAFPIWANLHGGCAIAFALIGAHWFERVVTRKPHLHLVCVGGAMIGLLLINPYGIDYPVYLLRALLFPRSDITEWRPVWLISLVLIPFILAISVVAGCLIYAVRRRMGVPFGSAIVITTGIYAGMHVKLAPVFAIAFICFVPGWLAATPLRRATERLQSDWGDLISVPWLIGFVVVSWSTATIAGTSLFELKVPGRRTAGSLAYPVGAVDYLSQERFSGNLMTPFESGAYCTWKLYPSVKVSLDSRYEVVFTEQLAQKSRNFYRAHAGWKEMLSSYATDVALIPTKAEVAHVMPSSGWTRVYSDSEYELYARPGLRLPCVRRCGRPPDGTFP